jgi:hypothetical protein
VGSERRVMMVAEGVVVGLGFVGCRGGGTDDLL